MIVMPSVALPQPSRRAFEKMAADGRRVLGGRFVALAAYTAADAALFGERITGEDLEAFGPLAEAWHHDGLNTPLVITPDEFRRSLDTFPIEYQAILDDHVIIAGTSPFGDARVQAADLRRACEIQAKSHLIHLRQGWIEAGGRHDKLAGLAARSAAPLRAILTELLRLNDLDAPNADALADAAARLAGIPADLVREVVRLDGSREAALAFVPRMPAYLDACERLWAYIDRARG